MLVMEQAADRVAAVELPEPVGRQPAPRRWPVLAMAAGLVLVGAALALVHLGPGRGAAPAQAPSGPITLGGPFDVAVQTATYEAGQTSGWHAHTGMHAVLVLSGTVTFYDGQCQGRTYGPGEAYVGGQGVHLVRNDAAGPAEMAVTYLFPAGRPHTTFHVASPAPAGCDLR